MASGLPVACSKIRGNVDLIDDGKGGFLFKADSVEDAAEALLKLMESDYQMMGRYNRKKIYDFDISVVEREINNIYSKELDMLCK